MSVAQMTPQFACALRSIRIESVVWTAYPIARRICWWEWTAWVRRKVAQYAKQVGQFDAVHILSVAMTRFLAQHGPGWRKPLYGRNSRTVAHSLEAY